jgi:hypothetical protein
MQRYYQKRIKTHGDTVVSILFLFDYFYVTFPNYIYSQINEDRMDRIHSADRTILAVELRAR